MITDHKNQHRYKSRKRALIIIRREIRTHSRMWVKIARKAPSNSTEPSHKIGEHLPAGATKANFTYIYYFNKLSASHVKLK